MNSVATTTADRAIRAADQTIDIVVPVYRGLDETKACLESIVRARCERGYELILVNDASPDKALVAWLTKWANEHKATLFTNHQNLGFAAACNRGLVLHSDRDVVLLNSDTEVVDGWLDRLASALGEGVASVTPFSNNASICSYPRSGKSNALPVGYDLSTLNALFRECNDGASVEIPTCVGFCTLLSRRALDKVGLLDESAFGAGYGEENEWSIRATRAGYKHLLCADLLVAHVGEVSFAGLSPAKRLAAAAKLKSLHPDYDDRVAAHIAEDPQRVARRRVDIARLSASKRPKVVLVTHSWGGGVERHVQDLVKLVEKTCEVLIVRPGDGSSVSVQWANANEDLKTYFSASSEFGVMVDFLTRVGVSRIHYHHIHGLPKEILTLAGRLGCAYDLTLHDHFPLTPQYHLAPGGVLPTTVEPGAWGQTGPEWRELMTAFLKGAARIICPSQYIADRIKEAFKFIKPAVWPHPELALPDMRVYKVLALGRMNPGKGLNVLVNCAIDAVARDLPLVFKVLGPITEEVPLYPDLPLFVHGSYDDEDLAKLIALEHADAFIFPAQVPETFSYTLSAAVETDLPIAASKLGAFDERLRGVKQAMLLEWNAEPSKWNDAILTAAKSRNSDSRAATKTAKASALNASAMAYAERYLKQIAATTASKQVGPKLALRDAYFFPPRTLGTAKEHSLTELYDAGVTLGQEESRRELRRRSKIAEREVAAAFAAAASARASADELTKIADERRAALEDLRRAIDDYRLRAQEAHDLANDKQRQVAAAMAEVDRLRAEQEQQASAALAEIERERADKQQQIAAATAEIDRARVDKEQQVAAAAAELERLRADKEQQLAASGMEIERLRQDSLAAERRLRDAVELAQDKQRQVEVAVLQMEKARAAANHAEALARIAQEQAGAALAEAVAAKGNEAAALASVSELTRRADVTKKELESANLALSAAREAEETARRGAEDARQIADAAHAAARQTREMMEQARFAEATARHAEIIARQTAEAARAAETVARNMAEAANAAANQAIEQLRARSSEIHELREVLQQAYNNYERLQDLSDRAIADARREREDARHAFTIMQSRLEEERDQARATLAQVRTQLETERDEARAQMEESRRVLEAERDEAREAVVLTTQRLEEERDEARASHLRIASSFFWRATWPARKVAHAIRSLIRPVDQLALESKRLGHRVNVAKTILQTEGPVALGKRVHEKLVGQADVVSATPPAPACEQAQGAFSLPAIDAPVYSIIVPIYGQIEMTRNCLKSVADTCAGLPIEVIVQDDCSPEPAAPQLADIGNLRVQRNPENLGFLRTCNRAAQSAKGKYIVLLNNDTIVQPNWLTEMARVFVEQERVGMVGVKLLFEDGKLQEAGGIVWQDGSAWNWGRGQDPGRPEFNYLREVDYCSGACLMIPRDTWNAMGGFDEAYVPAYYEETDLSFRLREKGLRVMYQPTAVVVHLEGKSSGTDVTQGVKQHQVINGETFKKRWEKVLLRHRANGIKPQLERDRYVKRRVLVVDACMLTPDQDSGSLRMFEMLGIMARLGCKVTFFGDNLEYREPYVSQIQAMGVEVLFHPYHSYMKELLEEIAVNYDVIMLSRVTVACKYVELIRKHAPKAKLIFDTVDLHYLRQERQAELADDNALRAAAAEMKKTELGIINDSDLTLVVSPVEEKLLAEVTPRARVGIVSNVHVNMPGPKKFAERKGVLFIGGFRHPPNLDAITWYVENVLPILRARKSGIVTTIIGSNAPPQLQSFAADDFIVAGFVPDVTPYYHDAKLSVSPLRYGAGVKGKVNLSMQYGVPVVATPMSAEGMYLCHGEDVMLASTPEEFADAVMRVHSEEKLWNTLSQGGLANIDAHFSRARAAEALSAALDL